MTTDPGDMTGEPPTIDWQWSRFDRWAGALLMVFAVVSSVAAVFVASTADEAIIGASVLVSGFATGGIQLVTVYGLAFGRAWARPVAVTLLWVAIGIGLAQVMIALTRNSLLIPFGAIGAVAVLRVRPAERPAWPEGHVLAVIVALAVMAFSFLPPAAAEYALRPGNSQLSVAPAAWFGATSCRAAGESAGVTRPEGLHDG